MAVIIIQRSENDEADFDILKNVLYLKNAAL